MKFNKRTKTLIILIQFFTFLLSGCGGSRSDIVANEPTVAQKPSVTHAIPPSLSVVGTIAPRSTPQEQVEIISPTPTTRATAMEVPVPTLTSDERALQVKEWLSTNAGCKLPCWWGIEPGRVTWNNVREFLNRIGARSSSYEESGMLIHETSGFDLDREHVFNSVSFVENSTQITAIIINASGLKGSQNFKRVWASFSPEKIIPAYGIPSRVWVKSRSTVHEGSPGPTMPYSVWIFYDQLGILFRYSGNVKYQSTYKMCPAFGEQGNLSDYLDIYLQSPDTDISLEQIPTVKYNAEGRISLEEASGISINEFYELFTISEVEPCFATPRSVWP